MESSLLEKLIIKTCCIDKQFLANLSSVFLSDYFDNKVADKIYNYQVKHFKEYGDIVPRVVIINEFDKDGSGDVQNYFNEIDAIEYDVPSNYKHLFTSANSYLKEKAIKKAILDSVDIINTNKDELTSIRQLVETALSKDLQIDLGLNYFKTSGERLTRILSASDIRVPTYFPTFDEYINGGFPPYTLTVAAAKVHGFKSSFMANLIARQVLHKHNVVLASMEMSEDAFAQRFDSIFSLMDINKLYKSPRHGVELIRKLTEIKNNPETGSLFIKQYPTGAASVDDFRKYLRELVIRGIKPSIFYCDYLNIMKPSYRTKGDMYSDIKMIAEELRALSFEFVIPVVSVSQLNREGSRVGFNEVDFTYISESMGTIATADAVIIFGDNDDTEKVVYESELWYKIAKNRLGGRVGEINKFFYDQRTLKMYCDTEQEQWVNDATLSGDTRNLASAPEPPVQEARGSRTRGATTRRR